MISALRPRLFVPSVFAIDLDRLWGLGVRGIIVDLDNTLVSWNHNEASADLMAWVGLVKRRTFQLCLVSNNTGPRVERFADLLGVPAIAQAAKPRRRAFRAAMRLMGTAAESTAVIGDQIFTDVLGGNRLHCYTILVMPLAETEYWATRLIRRVERFVRPDYPRSER